MNKTSGILELLAIVLLVAGCAVVRPHGQGGMHGWAKQDPQAVERQAKQLLTNMVKNSDLDLREEAVWIGPKTMIIRASWKKGSEPTTGLGATRHMADFVFTTEGPMTLQTVSGENPFL